MASDIINSIRMFRICPVTSPWPYILGATTPRGSWGGTTATTSTACILLSNYKAGGLGSTAPPFAKNIAGDTSPTCYAIAQSQDRLAASTISGTVTFTMMAQESNALANTFLKVYMWVKKADTQNDLRGVLVDATDIVEFPTTAQGISVSFAITPVTVSDGDLLIVEIGTANVVFAGYNGKLWFSGGCLSTGVFVDDMTAGSTTATLGTTMTMSGPVFVHQPVPDTGDVLGGNLRLALYDGSTGAFKREVLAPGAAAVSGGVTQSDGTILFAADTGFAYVPSWLWRYNADLSFNEYVSIGSAGINPHSLTRDSIGRNYIGYVGDNGTGCGEDGDVGPPAAPSYYVRRLSSAGSIDAIYPITPDLGGSQAVALSSDQRTLFYTSVGRKIKRYDVASSTPLTDFAVLPPATNGEVARGMAILPDGGVILADCANIKRLDTSGAVVQTYEFPASEPPIYIPGIAGPISYAAYLAALSGTFSDQGDWGVVALSPSGSTFWVANRSDYNDSIYGTLAQFDVASGDMLKMVVQGYVLPTGGGFCSGGLVVYGGFQSSGSEIVYPPDFTPGTVIPGVGTVRTRLIRRMRRSPHISTEQLMNFFGKFQLDLEPGVGLTSGQGVDPIVYLRWSDDGGHSYSSMHALRVGRKGNWKARVIKWNLGQARDRVFEVSMSDPVRWSLLAAYLDVKAGTS